MQVFISQPMSGFTFEEVKHAREILTAKVKKVFKDEDIRVLDNLMEGDGENPVSLLGMDIMSLSQADVAYFAKGWENARGCRVEHKVCEEYHIDIIEEGSEPTSY